MPHPEADEHHGGLSDALRAAVERTFAATAGSAAETRERAGELLDEVSRRGADAREAVDEARRAVVRRGQEARRAPRAMVGRVVDALRGRVASREEVAALREEITTLRARVAELEGRRRPRALLDRAKSRPKPKG
jgi:polyhydroxyalkanoate synthesis regulator phasin